MARLAYIQDKIVSIEEAQKRLALYQLKNEKVVFTNGCFDVLHLGHIRYLAASADLGKHLIVAINTDESVKRLGKAPNRPINETEARGMLVAALGFVDLVVFFNEDTPLETIKALRPDVLVKGADYDKNETDSSKSTYIVGSDFVREQGGIVETIDLVQGYSTTEILKKGAL
ncbi:MAG: adenylyltransferase/cytidyltransferase family protein [Flavobacteriales bacterium]